jgi:hypothetical protein
MARDKRTARFRYEEVREAAILALFDGRLAEAVRGLERAAGIARTTGDAGYPACYRHEVHLSLGFSLLELEEPERAFHHAERALEALAGIDQRPRHEHKMALYLAAHAALDAGSADAGSHYADQLQGTYYPGLAGIRDLLVAVRTCGMVNWLA